MNEQIKVRIESIDAEAKGIARIDGKTIFINDVLPNEEVLIEIYKRKPTFDLARLIKIITPSIDRVEPLCPNFGNCGGCSLQHMEFNAQILSKQKVLIDNLKHIGRVETQNVLQPIIGTPWGYRHRARMSAKYVFKKDSALVGFREKGSPYVADMSECLVLPKHISDIIPNLRHLISQLSIKDKIPQIEVAIGDKINVLVFRVMEPLSSTDEEIVIAFVNEHNKTMLEKVQESNKLLQVWLQPKGLDSVYPFYPLNVPPLSYELKNFGIEMPYFPTEFTQVNPLINQEMIDLALNLLDIQEDDEILDFFCGIGNFTLPMATKAKHVFGIEGSSQLVARATQNAKHNNLADKTNYMNADLFTIDSQWLKTLGKRNKWLIDPPRDGAAELIKSITPDIAPSKIVYISCNPATLARDAGVLVNTHGYQLVNAGVMNMFPHTSHVESIAEFIKITHRL
ncbi:MAG: 23S rRNA (uracil(1939)-C(5))-methyltransferase RlmD [Proteobacteria bacterium]|jgi:23S rRNA (uracil1939-C5)-methyltransferase|nr:23S rRNA (uracil(1939)-C(5))-methyltransferase RlmD [Pseudomonadota bacterium]